MTDPYKILGISRDASPEEVKKAYRQLAKENHPDKHGGSKEAEERFKEIGAAYEQITNPKPEANQSWSGFQEGFSGFGDIFGSIFNRTQRGANIQTVVNITFTESCLGATKDVQIKFNDPCNVCSGIGAEKGNYSECEECHGTGQQTTKTAVFIIASGTCTACSGRGVKIITKCNTCNGNGSIAVKKSHTVSIPSCVQTGNTIKIQAAGQKINNGQPGDLLIRINVIKDNDFTREGVDIISKVNISLKEALLGTEKEVKTIHNNTNVKIPACSKPGQKLSLKGLGAKNPKSGEMGKHLLILEVDFPTSLSDEAKKEIEKIL